LLTLIAGFLLLNCFFQPAYAENGPNRNPTLLMKQGNYREAFEEFQAQLLIKRRFAPEDISSFQYAIQCLTNLSKEDEVDEFREKVVELYSSSWQMLQAVATSYQNSTHFGYKISGKFQRGGGRGEGQWVSSQVRDRVRSLQLMTTAMKLLKDDSSAKPYEAYGFYYFFVQLVMDSSVAGGAWRLQTLTDLSQLPDYEDVDRYGYGGFYNSSGPLGAPVDETGSPVTYSVPPSFEESKSDGQRWRWLLREMQRTDPDNGNNAILAQADFCLSQFGTQTLTNFNVQEVGDSPELKTFSVQTLQDDETLAKLATGIKRFKLPQDCNYIALFRSVESSNKSGAERALGALASIYENRLQFDKAAQAWKADIDRFGSTVEKQEHLSQLLDNWGQFERVAPHAAGTQLDFEFTFRNANSVQFEAQEINVPRLLAQIVEYVKSNPSTLDWNKVDLGHIGYKIVNENKSDLLTGEKISWAEDLKPRPGHFDTRTTIKSKLSGAGAYLITSTVKGGNKDHIVVWLNDAVIIKKPLRDGGLFFVADALTGQPMPEATLKFFGYRQVYQERPVVPGRRYEINTESFEAKTDSTGLYTSNDAKLSQQYQWLITANIPGKKVAYLGFSSVWYGRSGLYAPNLAPKIFAITDRPAYRPGQTVHFKAWVAQSDYENESSYAGQSVPIEIFSPRGDKVLSKVFNADSYGGIEGELTLGDDAQTGQYRLSSNGFAGGLSFRVEEYKKPEFEVKIDAPEKPAVLGEKFTATILANYYFGAPVIDAKIHYKVLRTPRTETWFPWARWDWLFGPGYWWTGYTYSWLPGWRIWGCECILPWWPSLPSPQPEIVMEGEAKPDAQGKLTLDIDTGPAKAIHGNQDHSYEISAEVTDNSRRTINGSGKVIAARNPFSVTVWTDRGYYLTGETVTAQFNAHTVDSKPVSGKGELSLNKITYDDKREAIESVVQKWPVDVGEQGQASQQISAAQPGQYRLSLVLTDEAGHKIEGGYVFVVMGQKLDGKDFRFDHLELVPDRQEYGAGDKVRLLINTDRENSTVLLFVRPSAGIYSEPQVVKLDGRSTVREIEIGKGDMPNFFVEAVTVSDGKIYSQSRQIIVPPESKVLNLAITPSAKTYKPGANAKLDISLTDVQGKPFVGQAVVTIYDRAIEYISGGSNVDDIKKFFWSWKRSHYPAQESSIQKYLGRIEISTLKNMRPIGVFGSQIADEGDGEEADGPIAKRERMDSVSRQAMPMALGGAVPAPMTAQKVSADMGMAEGNVQSSQSATVEPVVRSNFADNAVWRGAIETDASGKATIEFPMPENLTSWQIRSWAIGHGTRVGEASTEITTTKNLLVRLQAPRFFVEKDEVVLSGNIHNYLKSDKKVVALLELDGDILEAIAPTRKEISVAGGSDTRVDFRVKAKHEGTAVIRMKALTDEESDAMEMKFPVLVHGQLKTDSFSQVINEGQASSIVSFEVPAQRRPDQSLLEIRYSPSIAMALVDALPYLVGYPYGCTEQTLNRFIPTVITQNILKNLGLDLKSIRDKRANLNPQEIGDPTKRAHQWKQQDRRADEQNPVFDEVEVLKMSKAGLTKLGDMQLSDGGWGWFSGYGEFSSAHTTATVVHGLQAGRKAGLDVPSMMFGRGVTWLQQYQQAELKKLANAKSKTEPWKEHTDDMDALVHMVLVDADMRSQEMASALYRDRNNLSVYAKALLGMTLTRPEDKNSLKMVMENIDQYLQTDNENQTSYLKLPGTDYWWNWYGSEFEANAYYLKLLSRVEPKGARASGLAKYLLNNRKHATYWNSTRDTALVVEALADFIKASGEGSPNMNIEVLVDGKTVQSNKITPENLFATNNTVILAGSEVSSGKHNVEIRRTGKGNVYINVYSTVFSQEDRIPRAGLEIKVNRKYYLLQRLDARSDVAGQHGQVVSQNIEKYSRTEISDPGTLKSGDLVEVELELESKNDYEYLLFEDMKPAGFEPVEINSGYNGNSIGAYVEFRDKQVNFFVRQLALGKHSVSYRVRAEIPGKFSALPTKGSAMYAPELRANSDETKIEIND